MSKRIYLILFIALISVSSTAVVIRYVELVPVLTLAFWRMLSASLFLWCYSIKKPQRLISLNNRNRIFQIKFDECVIFQKISDQEYIILQVLDHLEK